MFNTLAYYSSVLYRDFTAYTSEKLEKMGLHTCIWTGDIPSAASPNWWTAASSPRKRWAGAISCI